MSLSPADKLPNGEDKSHTVEEHQLHNNESQDIEIGSARSGVLNVFVSGLALFSDGYNAQISMHTPNV